ncbi:MAG: rhodanese-like domain-containing protein [Bacilli bacterium]|nr:rhodanese-like domain-containing protein [Bacilli bacterium]MBN2696855.1 rhodanese-like domain-containing protein [Bacilli bacterium]
MLILSIWEWVLPIGIGLLVGILISMRKRYDYTKIIPLDPEEFRLNMRKGQLIDIRSEDDYHQKKINGSRNFPRRSSFTALHRLRKDQPIFVYDVKDTALLRQVAKKFIRKGFNPVYVLKGGIEGWPFSLKE